MIEHDFDALSLCIKSLFPNCHPVPLHEPYFSDTAAASNVLDCISSSWVSSSGRWISKFEEHVSSITSSPHVVAVNSGTNALRLALHLVGVQPNDEVIVPAVSFVATANAVSHLSAIPHFVDIESHTLGICPHKLNDYLHHIAVKKDGYLFNKITDRRIAAIVPVHVFGVPAQIHSLNSLASDWNLPLVEDSAEALGSFVGNTHCGLFGDIGILSFNGNKVITTGAGGALLIRDSELARRARHLSSVARLDHPWEVSHDLVAWNDRMSNLNAALGVAQLEEFHSRINLKKQLRDLYSSVIKDFDFVSLLQPLPNTISNNWLISLRLASSHLSDSWSPPVSLLQSLHTHGILCRPLWRPLHLLPMYVNNPRSNLSETMDQYCRIISLPSSPQLLFS